MKTINTLIFVILSITSLKSQYTYTVKGLVPDEFDSQQVTLLVKDNIGRYTEHSEKVAVAHGKFELSGTMDQPCKRATIEINKAGKLYKGDFFLDTVNNIHLVVRNAQYGVLNIESNAKSALIRYRLDSLSSAAYSNYRKTNNIADSIQTSLPLQEGYQSALDRLRMMTEEYPNDYASLLSFYYLSKGVGMTYYYELLRSSLAKFSAPLQATALGQKIYEDCERSSIAYNAGREGGQIVSFKIKDIQGEEISDKSLLGKPYILAFTATWCVPCQESLPHLKALYENYKDKGLKVIYYYSPSNSNIVKVKEHIKKNGLNWLNVFEANRKDYLGTRLFVNYVPTYILIDKQGKIVYNSDHGTEGMNPLEGYLKKMF